ncbi:MAG: PIN domain-containing protein [Nitrososphaerales archaeon]
MDSAFIIVEEDPDGDFVVNTAHDGKADHIVSGDDHLKKLKGLKGIRIVTPKQMLEIMKTSFAEFATEEPNRG